MKYKFETVIDGIAKYVNKEIYSNMNELQEFIARVFIGRFLSSEDQMKALVVNNGFLRTFGVVDSDGMIELEPLMRDIKREIERKEKLTIDIPMFGKMSFVPSDVDELYAVITEGETNYAEN